MQDKIPLGDTLNFATTVPGYPASEGWTLKYRLVPRASGSAILLTAAVDEDDPDGYRVQETAATTAAWAAGVYSWASWVELSGQVYSLGSGSCTLTPDPRTAAAGWDNRSDAAIALANVQAVIAGRASSAVLEYEIAGRRLKYIPISDLVALESRLKADVAAEARLAASAAGYQDRRKIYVRLGRG